MVLTAEALSQATVCPFLRAAAWLEPINQTLREFEISTPKRVRAFLAQVSHESGRLLFVREIWDPAKCPWQGRYEGRLDLGNTQPGDGARFRGRGLIQITGRSNYRACGKALDFDFEGNPSALERREYAARSAGWFWRSHGCNELADAGDFAKITRTINGGLNGQADRLALWESARKVIA